MCHFHSKNSLGVELDIELLIIVIKCFALLSGDILSIRSFFTIINNSVQELLLSSLGEN